MSQRHNVIIQLVPCLVQGLLYSSHYGGLLVCVYNWQGTDVLSKSLSDSVRQRESVQTPA
jgi:hypothetical protein